MVDIWELRKQIGTSPSENVKEETKFYRGVEDIQTSLVDFPSNPYKALFTMVTSTWGNVWCTDKWQSTFPENRYFVVKAVLGGKSLPGALESFSFTFEIAGPSRSAFDQIARARIGAIFASMGWRDNCHADMGFRIPEYVWQNEKMRQQFMKKCIELKHWYVDYLKTGQANWQDARAIIPISATHRWSMAMNYAALQSFMKQRLMFSEQADTVAVAWMMRQRMMEKFPLLGSYLRPASDWAKRCLEHVGNDEMSQAFGCLFRCSGRWPCDVASEKYTFNTSCSDRETMMNQLGIYIPKGDENIPSSEDSFSSLAISDKNLFCAQ